MLRRLAAALPLALVPVLASDARAQDPRAATPASAAGSRPMTPEDVIGTRAVTDPQLSPDGQWIAYVVSAADTVENAVDSDVWLVRADGSAPARRLTDQQEERRVAALGAGRPSARLPERARGAAAALAAGPERRRGRAAGRVEDGRVGVPVVAGRRPHRVRGGAHTVGEEERRQRLKDDAVVVDSIFPHTRLWVLDVADRKVRELVQGDFSVGDPQWSPDGRQLAYVATPSPKADDGSRSDVWVVPADGGAPRRLTDNPGTDNNPRWSPDGSSIAFLTRAGTSADVGLLRLAVMPAAGGAPRLLAPSFAYQPSDVWWMADGRTLRIEAPTRTIANVFELPAAGGEPRPIFREQAWVGAASYSRDGRTVAVIRSDLRTPPDVHVARMTPRGVAGPLRKLTDHNPQVRALAVGRTETMRYKGADGLEVEGLVVYPADYKPGQRYPLMTQVHGGPAGAWLDRFPSNWGSYAHVWAGRGWVVFQPNPRGSTGYGEAFLRANIKDWGNGDYKDIQAGIDTLIARGVADPQRLAQAGWSYGGYMSAWTLTQTQRFKAIMVGAGLTNMESMYGTNDIPSTLDGYFGGTPYDNAEEYRKRSAMTFIKQAKTPTLILHGQQDLRVPTGQAQELYLGLKRNDVPVSLVFYPREGHGLGEPRHQLDKMRRELAWMTRWTLDAPKVMQDD
jgi:dipeptidyl aminopeptidase/acylaminoacyl peptidase